MRKELNKEWSKFGFRINEKGELLGMVDGKEYKCGKATFYAENGETAEQEEIERERERERDKNQSQIQQLRKRIAELEAIANRTPQQERELIDKKKELAELEKQEQNPNQKSWWPWIIGGGVILVLVIVIIYLLMREKEKVSKIN